MDTCKVFGTFERQFDLLESPTSVAVAASGDWAVLERDRRRIRVLAPDGTVRRVIGEPDDSQLPSGTVWDLAVDPDASGPTAITFGPDQRLTILSPSRVALFDLGPTASGVPWRIVSGLDLGEPVAAAWKGGDPQTTADDELWIADRRGSVIVLDGEIALKRRLDLASGFRFLRPSGVAIAPDGSVFVADEDANAIIRLDGAGREVARFGERGSFPGLFNAPRGLAIAGQCLYVTDELNHRITVHDFDGTFRSFWGMHAVVPREGEGKIHYPASIAIAPDGMSAYVAEPLERRVQRFGPSDAEAAMNSAMPSREGVLSHFGHAIACDGELLLLEEPETSSVFLFDLRDPTPMHVTTFGGSGEGPDRYSRVRALHVNAATQMAVVADSGKGRLAHLRIARDRTKPLKIDPFMVTLVRSWELGAWSDRVRGLLPTAGQGTLEPCGFAMHGGSLWTLDSRLGVLVSLDETLAPTKAIATGLAGASGLTARAGGGFATTLPDQGEVVLLTGDGSIAKRIGGRGSAFIRPTAVASMPDGTLLVTDGAADRVVVLGADGTVKGSMGSRGASDGLFWMPDGIAPYSGASVPPEQGDVLVGSEGPRCVVVDRGNHRAQVFRQDGTWIMTFGLGRAYTRPRERGET
ncbi:MAG: hypothetical protein JNL80_14970 [Phycisphaerae bacterium]|nr:hypothetical protein [Phycisphaerae bacterium]